MRSRTRIFVALAGMLVAAGSTAPLVDICDLSEDSWAQGPPMPYSSNHAMGAAHKDIVYNLGRYLAVTSVPTDRAIALVDGAWTDLPVMPAPRAAGAGGLGALRRGSSLVSRSV